jgi:hypothetical protein
MVDNLLKVPTLSIDIATRFELFRELTQLTFVPADLNLVERAPVLVGLNTVVERDDVLGFADLVVSVIVHNILQLG